MIAKKIFDVERIGRNTVTIRFRWDQKVEPLKLTSFHRITISINFARSDAPGIKRGKSGMLICPAVFHHY